MKDCPEQEERVDSTGHTTGQARLDHTKAFAGMDPPDLQHMQRALWSLWRL